VILKLKDLNYPFAQVLHRGRVARTRAAFDVCITQILNCWKRYFIDRFSPVTPETLLPIVLIKLKPSFPQTPVVCSLIIKHQIFLWTQTNITNLQLSCDLCRIRDAQLPTTDGPILSNKKSETTLFLILNLFLLLLFVIINNPPISFPCNWINLKASNYASK